MQQEYFMIMRDIIMVEDDLAREIVRRILKSNSLINNKLVHVLPCGGYTNTIDLAKEVISSNLTGKLSKINIVLDRDIKDDAETYIHKHGIDNNIPLNYLPIESLEKYLKSKLVDNVDHKLFRLLNDLVFHQKSISQIVEAYNSQFDRTKDKTGKKFYNLIDEELRQRGRSRGEIIEIVLDYLMENNCREFSSLVRFLKGTLI